MRVKCVTNADCLTEQGFIKGETYPVVKKNSGLYVVSKEEGQLRLKSSEGIVTDWMKCFEKVEKVKI